MITAVGCDDIAFFKGGTNSSDFTTLSYAMCSEHRQLHNGSCSGIGCWTTTSPGGLKWFTIEMDTGINDTEVRSFDPCGYSFIREQYSYAFQTLDISSPNFISRVTETAPLELDWAMGDQAYSQAMNFIGYTCHGNSTCVDSDTGIGGYWCKCTTGYYRNPYLAPGCKDVDECLDRPYHGICVNTPGNYSCHCQEGYHGDGTRNGSGCIRQHSNKPLMLRALGASTGLLLLLEVSFWLYRVVKKRNKHKRKQRFFKRNGGLLPQQLKSNECLVEKTSIFTAKELLKATDQFNRSRILGQGRQGTVYKGMLSDGRVVAVKRSMLLNENQLQQFINEVVILSQINHRNVVKLLGCCLETEVTLLVYEFIPNRTLFGHIHEESDEFTMAWDMRLRITKDIAGALAYLHYKTSIPIYHRDIKSSNILLVENYKAKISDFGTSRSVSVDKTHLTTIVTGTFGYLDPEYFQSSQFIDKSDVYSFVVVLVELLTSQKTISSSSTEKSLATRFLISMERNCLNKILDPKISDQSNEVQIISVANLACRCLNLNGRKRPTMKEVAVDLENISQSQRPVAIHRNLQEISNEVGASSMLSDIDSTWTITDYTNTFPSETDTDPMLYNTI